MKTKHLRDHTYPILVSIRNVSYSWFEGHGFIDLWVTFTLEPREVPVEIQSITLNYSGNWFQGLQVLNPCEIPPIIGTHLSIKAPTMPYTAKFWISPPEGKTTGSIKGWLSVEALNLPCTVELSYMMMHMKP